MKNRKFSKVSIFRLVGAGLALIYLNMVNDAYERMSAPGYLSCLHLLGAFISNFIYSEKRIVELHKITPVQKFDNFTPMLLDPKTSRLGLPNKFYLDLNDKFNPLPGQAEHYHFSTVKMMVPDALQSVPNLNSYLYFQTPYLNVPYGVCSDLLFYAT